MAGAGHRADGGGLAATDGIRAAGETVAGAALHVARTAVRRMERRIIEFAEIEPGISAENLAYVNRLSSLMFAMALGEDAKTLKRET